MKEHLGRIKLVAVVLGAVLAAGSMFDLSRFAERSLWSEQEADQLQQASLEYKRLVYERSGRLGLTEEEITQQRDRAKQRFEALQNQLEEATARPDRWRHLMLASAVVSLGVGLACHFADHDD